jgi:hypothetical protein
MARRSAGDSAANASEQIGIDQVRRIREQQRLYEGLTGTLQAAGRRGAAFVRRSALELVHHLLVPQHGVQIPVPFVPLQTRFPGAQPLLQTHDGVIKPRRQILQSRIRFGRLLPDRRRHQFS